MGGYPTLVSGMEMGGKGRDPTLHSETPPSGYLRKAPWNTPESL